jgi:hypothetical protein
MRAVAIIRTRGSGRPTEPTRQDPRVEQRSWNCLACAGRTITPAVEMSTRR